METLSATVMDAAGNVLGSTLTIDDGIVIEMSPARDDPGTQAYFFPGFIDLHCHGGRGVSFPDSLDGEDIDRGAATHARAGTTHLIASLVSTEDPLPSIRVLADACDRGTLIGIHLEGPYVSRKKAGAQNPDVIRPIDLDDLRQWLEAGRGWIKTVTIAPELDNSDRAVELLHAYGVIVSWGHTNANSEQTRVAIEHANNVVGRSPGQTTTHLFNAMPGLDHRNPGPVREFLHAAKNNRAVVEIIGDGVHVATELVADCLTYLDHPTEPGLALVTDALACAGMPNGDYVLGGLDVTMTDGVATLTGTSTIAGGASTLADQVIRLLEYGVAADVLARATMLAPARALGIDPPASPAHGKPLTGVLISGKTVRAWRDGNELGN
ncbi:N-acetylglucosamine-6-phosphate deacetylase [Flaviflexus massiliensis]|uniref:N-acetylglucosamine-6-phosphate deacetylase n=1 Tax=Flaviflexus massiliensis TaxID=1522309 RepID=UPI0006D59879|nr:amidohydrolase family protein [Flaviflexus massiliensis]